MIDSFLYDEMNIEDARRLGYFEPKTKFISDHHIAPVFIGDKIDITKDTQIFYYPGSFGSFHDGHLSVVKGIIADYEAGRFPNNFVIVIAPANSEYAVQKYGKWSYRAQNKWRFDNIVSVIKNNIPFRFWHHICIDTNPMIVQTSDQNFTDLIDEFVYRETGEWIEDKTLTYKPFLCFGKDCQYTELENSGLIEVFYAPDSTGCSTRNLPPINMKKKTLFLRCHTQQEYNTFVKYMGNYYQEVRFISIPYEIEYVKRMINEKHGASYYITICKDYAEIPKLQYVPLSRVYSHPLADPVHDYSSVYQIHLMDSIVIDSDIFSGGTRKAFGNSCKFIAIHDFSGGDKSCVELLDIDDFKNMKMFYQMVDVSSKCSLPAFEPEDHINLNKLYVELNFPKMTWNKQ